MIESFAPREAVFLDRDGTIIEEEGFLGDPDKIRILPNAPEAIKLFRQNGFAIVVVTNQSGVARGLFGEADVRAVNKRMCNMFNEIGAPIDDVFYCPHYEGGNVPQYSVPCNCRKPKTGMIVAATNKMHLQPTLVIGDRTSDIELGLNVGATAILVETGYGAEQRKSLKFAPDYIAQDLLDAAIWFFDYRKDFPNLHP